MFTAGPQRAQSGWEGRPSSRTRCRRRVVCGHRLRRPVADGCGRDGQRRQTFAVNRGRQVADPQIAAAWTMSRRPGSVAGSRCRSTAGVGSQDPHKHDSRNEVGRRCRGAVLDLTCGTPGGEVAAAAGKHGQPATKHQRHTGRDQLPRPGPTSPDNSSLLVACPTADIPRSQEGPGPGLNRLWWYTRGRFCGWWGLWGGLGVWNAERVPVGV